MSSPAIKMKEIFQFLQANKHEEIKKDYLLDMISFDDLRENEHGDTLLHYFFRQYDDLLPVSALEFLIQCFFRVDHYNNEDKTAVHILLERHHYAYMYFICFVKSGIPLFEKKGDSLSIFELLISKDNSNVFLYLIENLNLDYIRKCYYDISLSLSIKYESILILKMLIDDHLNILFEEFLNQLHLPIDEDDDTSANSQFFLAIKNSKKQIFKIIFKTRPNDRFITLEMLYHCSDTSFCIYLSKYIKEGEYSKISIQNDQNISPEIFRLVTDINSEVYGSRSIIHQAVKDGKLHFIRQIPPIMYDALDYSGNTPLYYAIKYEKNEVAKYLLKYGNCDFCHLGKKRTPLHVAVKGHPEILKKMLLIVNKKKYNFSFDINVKDRKGSTPLLAPFFLDPSKANKQKDINASCLRLIIDYGADLTACDSKGNNILFYTFEHYFDFKSDEFMRFILSKKNLSINENGKKELLFQLYNQNNQKPIDMFHERIETDTETLKIIFNKCNAQKIEKPYLLLKEKGKENDFFFECLKTANEKVFCSMLSTIDNLVFYIDEKDDNNNILFILANSFFNHYFAQIIIIFQLIIENNRDDFLFIQTKDNGDNFLHLAIRRRNDLLIKIFLDIYQKKKNQIFSKLNDYKDRIWSLVDKLFHQKNNDEKNKQNPIELGMFEIQDFHNIFHSDIFNIFQKEPSIDELDNFLKQYHNPNIIYQNEPLLLKYVRYEKFNEDEILKILELFNSYDCNFIVSQNNDYAALILLKKYYFKALHFLLDHRGLGKYAANIHDILRNSKKAFEILNLYNNSKNSLYVVKLYNDKKSESNMENLNEEQENLHEPLNFADDPQKDEFIIKCIENSQEETIKITNNRENVKIINNYLNDIKMENLINEIMEDHRNLTNLWDIIHDENKLDLVLNLIEDKNESRNIKNNLEYFKKNEENIILIDACLINEEICKRLKEYANYYDAFKNLIKYIEKAETIQNIIENTIKENGKHNEMDENFWPILPIIRRFSTFNAHCKLMIESFEKILLYETPIEKFFDVFVLFFEGAYRPFYIQMLSIRDQFTNIQMTDAKGVFGSFTSITLFFSDFKGNISSLIDYNLNDSMKEKLEFSKNKCSKVVQKIQVFSPQYEEFKSIIKNHKIVYDIEDFDITQLSENFYQVFVKIVDSSFEIFSPEKRLDEYYLIYSNEAFLVASVDSDEVHFLLKKSTSNVFCETFFSNKQSKLILFTFDGMIEFEQTDLSESKRKTLNNIGELMVKKKIKTLNKFFEDQWNLQRKSDINSEELININISHVDITMHPITYHFKYKRAADVNEVKEVGVNQISQNLYKNDPSMVLFYLDI